MNIKRRGILLILLAWLAYLLSYIGRADYGSCILEIVDQTGVSRATAGMVSSVFSICNAIGQVISGFLLKKLSPTKVITVELFTVACINILFPYSNSFAIMTLLWGINGCMQSTLLCGVTQIFVENLQEPYLSKGTVLLNTVGAVGGMFNYLLTWVLIRFFNWKSVFVTVAAMLFVFGVVWNILIPRLTTGEKKAKDSVQKENKKLSLSVKMVGRGVIYVVCGCFSIGFLRESVSLWIPSYISDVFGLSNSLSIIITIFVPGFQVCGALLGGRMGRRIYNLFYPSALVFGVSGLCLLFLAFIKSSLLITMILFVANAICMTAALTFLLSLFPIRFIEFGKVALYVGILNFCVHLGDFFSSWGIGWLSQNYNWRVTFGGLGTIACLAAVLCLVGSGGLKVKT